MRLAPLALLLIGCAGNVAPVERDAGPSCDACFASCGGKRNADEARWCIYGCLVDCKTERDQ